MAHELKHHLVDRDLGVSPCDPRALGQEEASSASEPIEIGAEVFAAELILPEADFANAMAAREVAPGACSAETLVDLKRETQTTMSYAALAKRAEFLGFAPRGSLNNVRWRKLEESLFGEPLYKRVQRARARRRPTS